jgi:hypothetical protein
VLASGCGGLPKHVTKTTRVTQPPPGKTLVNFHRPTGYGGAIFYPVFDTEGKFVCDVPGKSVFQYTCEPGKQVFMAWAEHVSVVEADFAPDKIYDVMIDVGMGWIQANITLAPLSRSDPRRAKLPEFEKREKMAVGMQRTEHVDQYEEKNQARIQEIKKDFLNGGPKADRVRRLGKDDCR